MKDYKELLKKLKIKAKSFELYEIALTHRSYLNEFRDDKSLVHNERLEFLGDAVLELIVSEHLFTNYKDHPEGDLTSFRAATVRTETLAQTSRELHYGDYLRMSKGEEATGGRDKDYLLANTFESVLGAVYLDLGFDEASKFVHRILIIKIANIVENRLDIDAKTKFQELAQAIHKVTPTYVVKKEEGPDHEKIFTMAVLLDKKEYGIGKGNSKQKAEEEAAAEGLKNIKKS